jgi:hypoxanthine phosphoribosyltransferase
MNYFDEQIKEVLISEEQIKDKVKEMGARITADYKDSGRELIVVSILRGSLIFAADLIRETNMPITLDTMVVSSYGEATKSSGVVKINKDLEEDIVGKDVLIVEDIVDTGLTLAYLKKNLMARAPHSVKVCTFLEKPDRKEVEVEVEYCGFSIPDEFVVGYGLDFSQKYRNYPGVASLKPETYM